MRVLCVGNMYPPHHLGGYELVWQRAVQALRAAGHGVRVLTTDVRFGDVDPARARPVVATGRGGSGEYLRDGDDCVLFAAGYADGLAGTVQRLAGDPGLRRGADGGVATAERHTAPRFEARVVAVLEDVAGR